MLIFVSCSQKKETKKENSFIQNSSSRVSIYDNRMRRNVFKLERRRRRRIQEEKRKITNASKKKNSFQRFSFFFNKNNNNKKTVNKACFLLSGNKTKTETVTTTTKTE